MLSGVSEIRVLPTVLHTPPCFNRRLMCRRELLLLGVGAANSTSIFGHKNNRQTMYYSTLKTEYETSTLFVFFFFFLRDRRSVMPKKSVRQMFRKYPDVVTIPQVCEMLGVSRNYAYLLVKQGKLIRLDLGRIVRVTKSSVIELKEKSLQKSENSPV